MPFQSEKQRRFLRADHPEIAKRWEKEYANGGYAMQGGVKNYLGNQEMVHAPKHWKSAPDHPKTELTYITEPEKELLIKADLHDSLNGNVNRGPQGIASLNGGEIYDVKSSSSSTNTGGGPDNREKYIATQYNKPKKKKVVAPPGEKGGPGYVEKPKKKKVVKTKDNEPIVLSPILKKKKKKKKDVVDKTLETVDLVDKVYKFSTTGNPLQFYKTNPYILGGSLLKGWYDKNKKKKKKSVDDQVSLIDENIVDIDVDTLSGDTDYTDIEGLLAFESGSKKDKQLKSLHKERELTKDLGIPFPAKKEKKYQKLLKEDQEQTEYPKSELLTAASGGIANHFKRKKFNTGSEPVIGDALFRGNWNDYSNEQLQMMFPDWDPEIESIDEHIKKKQSMNVDFAAVTEGNGILDLTEGEETTDVAEADTDEVIPSLVPSLDQEITLVANGGRILPKGPSGITSLNGWGDAGDFDRSNDRSNDSDRGPSNNVSPMQSMAMTGTPDLAGMTQKQAQTEVDRRNDRDQSYPDPDPVSDTVPGDDPDNLTIKRDWGTEGLEDEKVDWVEIPKHKSPLGPKGDRPKMIVTLEKKRQLEKIDQYVHDTIVKKTITDKDGNLKPNWRAIKYETEKTIAKVMKGLIPAPLSWFIPEHFPKVNIHGDIIDDHVTGSDLGWFQDTDWAGVDPEFEKDWDHLWDPGPKKDDDGDGPEVPLAPTIQLLEDEMYASRDGMTALEKIRANQAKRAMLVDKGIIQDNIIADENPITDITLRMSANSGGLANLFRVKNQ